MNVPPQLNTMIVCPLYRVNHKHGITLQVGCSSYFFLHILDD